MSIYPKKVFERSRSPINTGRLADENAAGRDASFICGSFVAFSLNIDDRSKVVTAASFRTNGCGFMIAAADTLCTLVRGKRLDELHGLEVDELSSAVATVLGPISDSRDQCVKCCIDALRLAFADHRSRLIEEFSGEKVLICTCFGVAEETIERHIDNGSARTVSDISRLTNAGTGCGSCLMLIQELLDDTAA